MADGAGHVLSVAPAGSGGKRGERSLRMMRLSSILRGGSLCGEIKEAAEAAAVQLGETHEFDAEFSMTGPSDFSGRDSNRRTQVGGWYPQSDACPGFNGDRAEYRASSRGDVEHRSLAKLGLSNRPKGDR